VSIGVSDNREQTKYWLRSVPDTDPIWGPTPPFFGAWNGTEIPRPPFGAPELQSDYDSDLTRFYAAAQWQLSDALSLITGLHHFDVEKEGTAWSAPVNEGESKTSPYVGAVWSVTDTVNLYASYSDIFRPQNELNEQAQFLGPSKGKNFEIGAKKTWFDGTLLSSLALYQAEQSNYAEWGGDAGGLAWFRGVDIKTQGLEIDIAGRVNDLWTLQAGYTYLDLKDAGNGDERTYLPAHAVTLLGEVDVPNVSGLSLAASLRWQDEVHYTSQNTGTRVSQPSYAVLGLSATYDFNERLSVALNLDNVTDEAYLNSLYWADIYAWDQAYYGEPRSATLRLTYDW
jgi:outer membrane receptor for ferric coprogen and ferric-rhodotorulic acid